MMRRGAALIVHQLRHTLWRKGMKQVLLFAAAGAFLAAASASAQSLQPLPAGPGVVAPSGSTITARPSYAPPPPPPRAETPPSPPPVAPGATPYVWQPGRWAWTGSKYVWVSGRWSQTTQSMGR
jgi:hypothetical protein